MLIEIKGIKKTYQMGETMVPALRNINCSIDSGEFVAIMGPSGSGKSTLMHILGLLDTPDSGSYRLAEQEISGLTEDELSRLRGKIIGFVFQQFNLIPRTSALENVALPLLYTQSKDHKTFPKHLLEQVGLEGRINHKPNELSGGQQQRVAIARALVNQPRIIFADEPTGNLDSKSQNEIMHIFKKLNEQGLTIILVTHEEEVAANANRIIKMRDGMILSDEIRSELEKFNTVRTITKPAIKTLEALFPQTKNSPSYSLFESSEHFKQAWRSLSINKVRTGLSMLGILIGVGAVISMLALGQGAKETLEKQLSSLGSNLLVLRPGSMRARGVALQTGEVTKFTIQDAEEIKKNIPMVKDVSPSVTGRGQIVVGNKNWNSQILGASPQYASMRASSPYLGRFFTHDEDRQRARVAVLGQTIVRELFLNSNPIGEMIKINKINFQVIGILPEKGATSWRDQDDIVVIPLNTAMRRVLGKDFVDSIDIEIMDANSMEDSQEQIKNLIIQNHRIPASQQESFEIRNLAEIQAALSETSRTMSLLLGSIALISLIVGGIGIMNIMLVSVTERTREIGLRKAVGAKQFDILSQFLIEAVVVSCLGGLAGIVLGASISFTITQLAGWTTNISLESILIALLFSLGVGIGFGLWPAKKAASLNPIDALRYE